MLNYFSVDVETTATDPNDGAVTNIGIQVVNQTGLLTNSYYRRIKYDPQGWDAGTRNWWDKQNSTARSEVLTDVGRVSCETACEEIISFIREQGTDIDDTHSIVFVANPASFDFAFVQKMFHDGDVIWPFSHRSLCLRSLAWGFAHEHGFTPWQEFKPRTHRPLIPHHALYDAQAQAMDLSQLLAEVRGAW